MKTPKNNKFLLVQYLSIRAMHHLLHGDIAKTLNEGTFDLSDVNCWVQTSANVHHDISSKKGNTVIRQIKFDSALKILNLRTLKAPVRQFSSTKEHPTPFVK